MNSLIIPALTLIGFGLFGIGFELLARYQERKRDAAIIPWQHGRTPSMTPYAPHAEERGHR